MNCIQATERTKEFSSIIQRLVTRSQVIGGNNSSRQKNVKLKKCPEIHIFKNQAEMLNNQVKETEMKLYQMRIFIENGDFSKCSELTDVIRVDLSNMSKEFSKLQDLLKTVNGGFVTQMQTRAHISGIAIHIQKRFQNLAKDFKDCIKFKENLVNRISTNHISSGKMYNNEDSSINSDTPSSYLAQKSVYLQDNEIRQRETSAREVEATIVQLGDVFEQFSTVVQEQDELIFNISKNTSATFLNIEEAHTQLSKYFHSIKNHRAIMIRVFVIVAVLVTIFTYFL